MTPVRETVLVVPCYNEARRLATDEFVALVRRRPELSLLFVDDGSSDDTARIIAEIRAEVGTRVMLHRLDENVGKAEAVRQGLLLALEGGADFVGYADADLSTPTAELDRLAMHVRTSTASVVLGARVQLLGRNIARHAGRHYLGRVFATFASIGLGIPVYDTQCGAKFFRRTEALRAALERPFRTRWIFDVELLDRVLRPRPGAAALREHDLEEVPLREWRDVSGSKLGAPSMLWAGMQLLGFVFHAWADRLLAGSRTVETPWAEAQRAVPAAPLAEPEAARVARRDRA